MTPIKQILAAMKPGIYYRQCDIAVNIKPDELARILKMMQTGGLIEVNGYGRYRKI